jgi:hypothetical protein
MGFYIDPKEHNLIFLSFGKLRYEIRVNQMMLKLEF